MPSNSLVTELLSRFSVYGKIVNEKKTLRSYGTHVLNKINIEYETALEAKAALDGEDGRDFNGSKLRVQMANVMAKYSNTPLLVVTNIPRLSRVSDLIARFSVYGKVAHSIKTEQFMHGNDFAFLKFESTSAALEAIAGEDGSEFNGGILRVEQKHNKNQNDSHIPKIEFAAPAPPNKRIFVAKLKPKWNPDELLKRFSSHGEIVDSSITEERSADRKRFVHVEYRAEGQARRAVEVENGAMFGGKEMKVEMAEQTEEGDIGATEDVIGTPAAPREEDSLSAALLSADYSPIHKKTETNIVVILCVSPEMLEYGEFVKGQLADALIPSVGLLQPSPGASFQQVFEKVARDGSKYACIFTSKDIAQSTLSVKSLTCGEILADVPVAEAVNFIKEKYLELKSETGIKVSADVYVLPAKIRAMMGFIAESRSMSVVEYDNIIRFMVEYRDNKLKEIYGTKIPAQLLEPPLQLNKDPVLKSKREEVQSVLLGVLEQYKDILRNQTKPEPNHQSRVAHTLAGALRNQQTHTVFQSHYEL